MPGGYALLRKIGSTTPVGSTVALDWMAKCGVVKRNQLT
jgi:hypothetical protein